MEISSRLEAYALARRVWQIPKPTYNGNVLETREYDWFSPSLVTRDPNNQNLPTGVPASATLLRKTTASYHNQADLSGSTNVYAKRVMGANDPSPLILNAVKETTAGTLSTTLSRSRFYYDSSTNLNSVPLVGNLTREEHDRDGTWIHSDHIYDSRGNRTSTTDPRGNTTTFVYGDSTLAQPTSITVDPNNQVSGDEQTTQIVYDYYTGLVTSQTDPNNVMTSTSYTNQLLGSVDPFGRPGKVTGPFVQVNINGVVSTQRRTAVTKYFDSARQVETFSDLNSENDAKLRSRVTADELGRAIKSESSESVGKDCSMLSAVHPFHPA